MRAMFARGSVLTRVARLLLVVATIALAACGGHKSANKTVGVGIGVTLSSPTGTTVVASGATIEIDAVVSNDPAKRGVTWTFFGGGAAVSSTDTKYVYQAPSGVAGANTVTLTATSISDPRQVASVTLIVNGTPLLQPPVVFPANINVPYAVFVTVGGGLAPYTWTLLSGSLPAGLALNGSTSQTIAITGTPTTLGTSNFVLQLADSNGAKIKTNTLTITVNPKSACVLNGQYTYLFTGFRGGQPVVRAGTVIVASDGTITGEYDYKDSSGARTAEQVSSGTCTTVAQNRGWLQLVSPAGTERFDFGTRASLNAGQLQENDATPVVGSGQFFNPDKTAFSLAAIAGDFTFGLVGDDGTRARMVAIGRLTLSATGAVSAGEGDSSSPLAGPASLVTGAFTSPDSFGRGTAQLLIGGLTLPVAYYVRNANTLYVVSNDASNSTPRLAGRMTRQTGAGAFNAASLTGPAVLSLFGSELMSGGPAANVGIGRLSAGGAGTVSTEIDSVQSGVTLTSSITTGAQYSVSANGRGTLQVAASSNSVARDFVMYLSGPSSGYLLEPGSAIGTFGIMDAQTGAPFLAFPPTYFVGGSVFSCSSSPITLAPQVFFNGGSLSGNLTGSYALNPTDGRLLATVQRNIFGGTGLLGFLISSDRIVTIGNGVNSVDSTIAWFESYSEPN